MTCPSDMDLDLDCRLEADPDNGEETGGVGGVGSVRPIVWWQTGRGPAVTGMYDTLLQHATAVLFQLLLQYICR